MMTFAHSRLRKPVVIAAAGTLFAAAWLVRGGPLWWVSIMSEIAAIGRAISMYVLAGTDTDEGALAGSRADERQQLISLRSRALAGNLAAIAAFAGLTIAIAANAVWWWPFLLVLAVWGFGYLFGLSTYGVSEEGQADEANAGRGARSPVS